jgi:hypothetical protein
MNLPTICYFHGYVPIAGLAVRAEGAHVRVVVVARSEGLGSTETTHP